MHNRSIRVLAVLAAVWGAWPAPLSAQPVPPPQGKPVEVSVLRGESTGPVFLVGSDRNLRNLEFKIERGPRHGKVSAPSKVDGERGLAVVTYRHGDDDASEEDSFTYRVRANGGGPWGQPWPVRIRIVDRPPVLGSERRVAFPETVAGERTLRQLTITNTGGGVLRGSLEPRAPFAVEGDNEFSLPRGRSRTFAVVFSPERPDSYREVLQPGATDATTITLAGEAVAPFTVMTEGGELTARADDSRTASLRVTSRAAAPLPLDIETPEGVGVVPAGRLELPPRGEARVELRVGPETKGPLGPFTAVISGAGHEERREFSANAIPPRLEVMTPDLDFGTVERGLEAQAELTVRNTGGAAGRFTLQLPAGLRAKSGAEAFEIPPDGAVTVKLTLKAPAEGPAPTEIAVAFGGRGIRVPVRATLEDKKVAAPSAAPTPRPTPPPRPLQLNQELVFAGREGDAVRIEWQTPQGFEGAALEMREAGSWGRYEPPAPVVTWWQRLAEIPAGFLAFFRQATDRPELDRLRNYNPSEEQADSLGAAPPPPKTSVVVAAPALQDAEAWRVTARDERTGTSGPISEDFLVDTTAGRLQEVSLPEIPAEPAGSTREVTVAPFTPILDSSVMPGRAEAKLQVVLDADPQVTSFRLERLAIVQSDTSRPGPPEFRVVAHPEGGAEVAGIGMAEHEGRKLTVVSAQVRGLEAGTASFWRLVPLAGKRELPPTQEMLVGTLPVPPFPWDTVWLVLAFMLLAGVLFLRWRQNRPPAA